MPAEEILNNKVTFLCNGQKHWMEKILRPFFETDMKLVIEFFVKFGAFCCYINQVLMSLSFSNFVASTIYSKKSDVQILEVEVIIFQLVPMVLKLQQLCKIYCKTT